MENGKGLRRVVVLASRNPDKLREMKQLSAGLPFDVRPASDWPGLPDVLEDGTSALANARRKALVTAAYTGEIAVADDTALQVRALGGLPDIFAARFAGPEASYADNTALLLDLMRDVPDGHREACFLSATVWIDPRPAAVGAGPPRTGDSDGRWLHNPFARAIHIGDPTDEDRFWNGLADRGAAWRAYAARLAAEITVRGVDQERLASVRDDLTAAYLAGGRPAGVDPGALRLPDTRIWTAQGRDDLVPRTEVAPTGLPADAPGRADAAPVWCELSAQGRLWGEITRSAQGGRGFGYDPVFRPDGCDRALADLNPDEKNALSHRGRALRKLFDAARGAYGLRP